MHFLLNLSFFSNFFSRWKKWNCLESHRIPGKKFNTCPKGTKKNFLEMFLRNVSAKCFCEMYIKHIALRLQNRRANFDFNSAASSPDKSGLGDVLNKLKLQRALFVNWNLKMITTDGDSFGESSFLTKSKDQKMSLGKLDMLNSIQLTIAKKRFYEGIRIFILHWLLERWIFQKNGTEKWESSKIGTLEN